MTCFMNEAEMFQYLVKSVFSLTHPHARLSDKYLLIVSNKNSHWPTMLCPCISWCTLLLESLLSIVYSVKYCPPDDTRDGPVMGVKSKRFECLFTWSTCTGFEHHHLNKNNYFISKICILAIQNVHFHWWIQTDTLFCYAVLIRYFRLSK